MKAIDLSGQTFGRFTVLERAGSCRQSHALWLCKCLCGIEKVVSGAHLRKGAVKSCGCLRKEILADSRHKHGGANTPTWNVWRGMIKRCTSKNFSQFKHYGGRGIKVCYRWLEFPNFLSDMGERPEGASIERIDVNGDYEPENCKWIPLQEQPNNTRRSFVVELHGKSMCLRQACDSLGLKYARVRDRIQKLGWTFEQAIAEPKKVNGSLYAEELS